jgi:DNA repair protein RecO (recombination protein O)
MEERTTGLILRTRLLTETSLIIHWLTQDFGRLSTVAKGARRPKSPFLGKLDLFYLADFTFHPSRRSELHTLREISVLEYHPSLRQDWVYLCQASYFVQLLEQTTETNTPLPGLLDLLNGALQILPQRPPDAALVLAFETKLLSELGLKPDVNQTRLSPGTRQILEQLSIADWTVATRLRLSPAQQDEIDRFLHGLILSHVGQVPKGRAGALASVRVPKDG